MGRRVQELTALRNRLEAGNRAACDEARKIGMSLRGSGATFGFPRITELATPVEIARDEDVLRRVEGLISELTSFTTGGGDGSPTEIDPPRQGRGAWLARAAGIPDVGGARDLDPEDARAWEAVAKEAGFAPSELARRVASYFGLEVADLSSRTRAALRLVPEARLVPLRVIPLAEDPRTITVATADPTALATERELERLTGRKPRFVVAHPDAIDAVIGELYERVDQGRAQQPGSSSVVVGASSDREPGHILVVDDEPGERLLVRTILEQHGYEVIEAEDGEAALEAVRRRGPIGLVVADLNMPRMDGLELLWELRDGLVSELIPVIVVTGERDEILESQLLEEGADDYIRKPVDPRLFVARVESTARRVDARLTRRAVTPGNA
jgi:CheY-like chemotaxis protein